VAVDQMAREGRAISTPFMLRQGFSCWDLRKHDLPNYDGSTSSANSRRDNGARVRVNGTAASADICEDTWIPTRRGARAA